MTGLTEETVRRVGLQYGLTALEVHRALAWARTAKLAAEARTRQARKFPRSRPVEPRRAFDFARFPEPKDGKVWCVQCERRVRPDDAAGCSSRFCRAKVGELAR